MIDLAQLRRLVAYNQWADEKILKAIDGMTQGELDRPVEAYVGSIGKNVGHTLGAQKVWLARYTGQPRPSVDPPPVDQLRSAFAAIHRALRDYVAGLTEAEAGRTIQWTNFAGQALEGQLDQLIVHLVNHGSHHRAETGLLLERIGRSPGDMDYMLYHLEHR